MGKKDTSRMANKRSRRLAAGLCQDCGTRPKRGEGSPTCERCLIKRREYGRRKRAERIRRRQCTTCGQPLPDAHANKTCESCVQKQIARSRDRRKKDKRLVVSYLGGKCKGCDIDDIVVMTVHHVNGDGCRHRERLVESGVTIYHDIAKRIRGGEDIGYELELLCCNCHARKTYGSNT